jgi:inosose dehydratase
MNSVGEAPGEVAHVLDATDARYVHLLFDVAHYQQGGADPVRAIHDYASRIRLFHLKDVEARPSAGQPASRAYRFVELGRGRVDLSGVIRAIHDVAFRGWVVVELDAVPDNARTPRESAEINRRYLVDTLHQTL